ncbi:hypothetical protein QYE76_007113 [Lolium multiflorum]|uniref:F-box domain-containing protein n=1 Tax=Lolium multiflorum TaxID=4521 RepID=A0AAD8RX11_LOLMU|nr:hypothetical protein QYE76_007113 [Lolium multiflorum]
MAAAAAAAMPDDILLEILFRLKHAPAVLFRCATACKRWRGLVADPAFLRRCWPDQDASSSMTGFFTQELEATGMFNVTTPCFTPTPRSVLGPGRRTLRSFMTAAVPAGLFDRAVPLASRHGLLLVRLDTYGIRGYAILTGTDCPPSSTDEPSNSSSLFKVVIIGYDQNYAGTCTLHTFSSDEASWRVGTHGFDSLAQPNMHGSSCRAVVHRGTAHWLFSRYGEPYVGVLDLNMRTGHVTATTLPIAMCFHHDSHLFINLAARTTTLSMFCMQKRGTQLEIWEQREEQPNEDRGSAWVCTSTVELKQPWEKTENEARELYVLGDKCGTLLVNDTIQGVYTADLQTGMMEEVLDWPHRSYINPMETVPLELDWPSIFASRLDTRFLIDSRHDAFAGWVDAKVGSLISLNRAKDDIFLFLKELARHKLAGKQPMASFPL